MSNLFKLLADLVKVWYLFLCRGIDIRGADWILDYVILHGAGIITYHTVLRVSRTIHLLLGQEEVKGNYHQHH